MKIIDNLLKIMTDIFKKSSTECELEGQCPIYLSYLGQYDENIKKVPKCNNANKIYCKKHQLVDIKKWETLSSEEKLKVIVEMELIIRIDDE